MGISGILAASLNVRRQTRASKMTLLEILKQTSPNPIIIYPVTDKDVALPVSNTTPHNTASNPIAITRKG